MPTNPRVMALTRQKKINLRPITKLPILKRSTTVVSHAQFASMSLMKEISWFRCPSAITASITIALMTGSKTIAHAPIADPISD